MKDHRNGGFTYIGVLAFIALTGLLSSKAMVVVSTSQRAESEKELIFIGQQFKNAIASYYHATPSGLPPYPSKPEDLLLDPRFAETRRHLRKKYIDPVTRQREWGLIVDGGGGIKGIHSLSAAPVMKKGGFPAELEHFSEAVFHHDWIFEFHPSTQPGMEFAPAQQNHTNQPGQQLPSPEFGAESW